MNRIHRLVWNTAKQVWVAAAEHAPARGRSSSPATATPLAALMLALLLGTSPAAVLAQTAAAGAVAPAPRTLPGGGEVVAGRAAITVDPAAATLTVNQSSERAAIDWQTFNVGSQGTVNFVQPGASSVTLNRVNDANPSQIFGRINANGQVFLSNPNGVYFAPGAQVDVGGLVATTHRISLDDFMAGRIRFERHGATGSVVNEGELRSRLGGYIALLAPEVRNQGVILAQLGTVALAAGEAFELTFDGSHTLAGLRVQASTIRALVDNRSAVLAPGGLILLSAQAADQVQGGVIRNSGTIEATGLAERGGRLVLEASSLIDNSGRLDAGATATGPAGSVALQAAEVINDGTIAAAGDAGQDSGGRIAITAGDVTQTARGRLDASGARQGGTVEVTASGRVALEGRIDGSAQGIVRRRGDSQNGTDAAGHRADDALAISAAKAAALAASAAPSKTTATGSTPLATDGTAPVTKPVMERAGSPAKLVADTASPPADHILPDATSDGVARTVPTIKPVTVSAIDERSTLGGRVAIRAARIELTSAAIDVSGGSGGAVVIDASQPAPDAPSAPRPTPSPGSVALLGATDIGSRGRRGQGGSVTVLGEHLALNDTTRIDASGSDGGGTVLIGGDWQGAGPLAQATTTTLGTDARIEASALDRGNGGTVVLWSDAHRAGTRTEVAGTIIAAAGAGGLGGQVETSGHALAVTDTATVQTGAGGQWLLDPATITIGTTGDGGQSNTGGTFTPGSGVGSATIHVNTLTTALNSGNVTVTTQNSGTDGSGDGDIFVNAAINKTGTGESTLSLRAARDIRINNSIRTNTGKLNLVLIADWDSANAGAVFLNGDVSGLTLDSKGGHVWIGGNGYAPGLETVIWNGLNVGTGAANSRTDTFVYEGVNLSKVTVRTAGGDLKIHGINNRLNSGETRYGVWLRDGTDIQTGTGKVDITGTLRSITGTPSTMPSIYGVGIDGSSIQTTTGQITITGGEDASSTASNAGGAGVTLYNSTIQTTGATGNITITGTTGQDNGTGNPRNGVQIDARGDNARMVVATQGGDIAITGTSNVTNHADSAAIRMRAPKTDNTNVNNAEVRIVSRTGNVSLTGDNPANAHVDSAGIRLDGNNWGRIRIGHDGSNSYSGNTTLTTSSLARQNFGSGYLSLAGSGGLTVQPINATTRSSFTRGNATPTTLVLDSAFDLGSNHSSLTIGRDVGSTTLSDVITVQEPITTAGPLTIHGGTVNVNANLSTTTANGHLVLRSSGNIIAAANTRLDTRGGALTLWADTNANGGYILLNKDVTLDSRTQVDRDANRTTTASGGGAITLGGGTDLATGYAYSPGVTDIGGINLGNQVADPTSVTTVLSGGGDIVMRGTSSSNVMGINWVNGGQINAGTGTITMVGINTGASGHGMELGSWQRLDVTTRLVAGGGDASRPAIRLDGTSNGSSGVVFVNTSVEAPGAGGINVTGRTTNGSRGVNNIKRLLAASGPIVVDGGSKGIATAVEAQLGALAGSTVPTSSSAITLTGDTVTFNGTPGATVTTTGALTVQPSSGSFSGALTWPISNLTLAPTVSGLTLGKVGNTADIIVASNTSIAGPIRVYGGSVNANADLNTTLADAEILLQARGNLIVADGKVIRTNGGDITLWSDRDGDGSGYLHLVNNNTLDSRTATARSLNVEAGNSTSATGGGNITLAGGNGSRAADGQASSNGTPKLGGVNLGDQDHTSNITTLYSGGGDVVIRGRQIGSGSAMAVQWINAGLINAGQGKVSIDGENTGSGHGVELGAFRQSGSVRLFAGGGNAATPAIDIRGIGAAAGNGIQTPETRLYATGAGGINLYGRAGSTGPWGIVGSPVFDILATSGPITVDGGSRGFSHAGSIGALSSSPITTSSSPVTLTGDRVEFSASGAAVRSSGSLTVQPSSTSFSSDFSWPMTNLGLSADISGLTLGKAGNTRKITVTTATTIAGAIDLYGGQVAIDAPLTATGSTIRINASGTVTDGASGSVQAANLVLNGGSVTLDSASNAVGTLAATGVSALTYRDTDALTLGSVAPVRGIGATVSGISATGIVDIATRTGDLTLAANAATTLGGATALTLNAGQTASPGTATGGNLIISGSPTVSVGSGGTARLFSGSVAGSTGLTSLVSSGSGRFRYNSDETTNFAGAGWTALGSGVHGLYRQRPTVTVSIDNGSTTYGDAATDTLTVSGSGNGESFAQAFGAAPTVTIGGAHSTSGRPIVGDHALSASGAGLTSPIGLAFGGAIDPGTLTVTRRTLTTTYSAADKVYDGSTGASVTALDNRISGDQLTVGFGAAFADRNVGSGKTVNVTAPAVSGTDAGNYLLASGSDPVARITPKPLTASLASSASKVYDGTDALVSIGVDLAGVVTGDTVTASASGGSYADHHAATNLAYSVSGVALGGTDAANYSLAGGSSFSAGNGSITPRPLTATAVIRHSPSKVYDGTVAATGATIDSTVAGAIAGDTITLDTRGIGLSYDSAHVADASRISATGTAEFAVAGSNGSLESDYALTAQAITDVAASITPAPLTAVLTNAPATRVYDGTTAAPAGFTPTWSVSGLVTGDTAATIGHTTIAYDSRHVTEATTLTVSGVALGAVTGSNGSQSSDYALGTSHDDITATITPKPLTVTGLVASDKTYDGTTLASIYDWGRVNTGVAGETLVITGHDASFDAADAGVGRTVTATDLEIAVDASGSGGGVRVSNYSLTSPTATTTADIGRAVLTVTANDDARFVASPEETDYAGVTYTGFVNGETRAVLTGSASVSRSNADVTAGHYAGVLVPGLSGLSSGNYTLQPRRGSYSIVPSNQLLVRMVNTDTVYGSAPVYGIAAAEYHDGSQVVALPPAAITDHGHGVFTVTDGAGGSATFTVASNAVPLSGSGQRPVEGYTLHPTAVTAVNPQNFSDVITLVGNESVSRKPVTAFASGGAGKVYDGTVAMTGVSLGLNGLVAGDTVSVDGLGAFSTAHAGDHLDYTVGSLTLAGGDAGNYSLAGNTAFSGSDGRITPRPLTASAVITASPGKVYDGTTAAPGASVSGTVTGGIAGDQIALDTSGLGLAYDSSHVATATGIVASGPTGFSLTGSDRGSLATDYNFIAPVIGNAAATITPAPLTVALTNAAPSRVYDGTTAAPEGFRPTWAASGLVAGDSAVSLTSAGAAYDSHRVLEASRITVTGIAVDAITGSNGSRASDYALTASQAEVSATLTPATVTAALTEGASKVYDGSATMVGVTLGLEGVIGGDAVTATGNGGRFATSHAGSRLDYTVDGVSLGGSDAGNYQLAGGASVSGNDGTITPRPLSASAAISTPPGKVYDGTTAAPGASISGSVTGAIAGDTVTLDAGNVTLAYDSAHAALASRIEASGTAGFQLSGTAHGSLASDYAFTSPVIAPAPATITPAPLTASLDMAAPTRMYDGTTAAPAGFVPTWRVDGLVAGDTAATLSHAGASYDSRQVAEATRVTVTGAALTAVAGSNGSLTSDYVLVNDRADVAASITAKPVSVLVEGGRDKVYDGTTTMPGLSLTVGGVVSGDAVSAAGTGRFEDRRAGTAVGYAVSDLALGGTDAANYRLDSTSLRGDDGSIARRALALTWTAGDKVYDGNTVATVSAHDDRIAGDSLAVSQSAAFGDKNVGVGKPVTISGVTLGGADADNYRLGDTTGSASASISRLDSVTWTGGASGNWFDSANWAGGAVPDLANVANVIIPANVTVGFDSAGASGPADATQPVRIDSLGAGGSLTQVDGTLVIGQGGLALAGLDQAGGTLSSDGEVQLDTLHQSGGNLIARADLDVRHDFSQGTGGSIAVGGDVRINDAAGGTTAGQLDVAGDLAIVSTDGAIVQGTGTAITVGGRTTVSAGAHDIRLDGVGNDFGGPISADGHDITVVDGHGGVALGDVTASSALAVTSRDGDISQQPGASIRVQDDASFIAPESRVTLSDGVNAIGGKVLIIAGSGGDGGSGGSSGNGNNGGSNGNDGSNGSNGGIQGSGNSNGGQALLPTQAVAWQAAIDRGTASPPGTAAPVLPTPVEAPAELEMTGASAQPLRCRAGTPASQPTVQVDGMATAQHSGSLSVRVGGNQGGNAAGGGCLSFSLPAAVSAGVPAGSAIQVSRLGAPGLPAWLRFDGQTGRFEAGAIPAGALPLKLHIDAAGRRSVLEILPADQ